MSMSDCEIIHAAEALAAMPQPTETDRGASRRWYATALARFTERRRQELGLSVAEAAELSGLELSQWCALETGWVPDDLSTLRAIAGALEVRWTDFAMLAFWSCCAQSAGR